MIDKANDFGDLDYYLDQYPSTDMTLDGVVSNKLNLRVYLYIWDQGDEEDCFEKILLFKCKFDDEGYQRLINCQKYLESRDEVYSINQG